MSDFSNKAKLYQKIIKVMEEVGQLRKDGSVTNSSGKKMYDYLSEEQTTSELQQAFIKHGIIMFPINVKEEFFYIETMKHGESIKSPITKVLVTYKLCDTETGEHEEIQSIGYGSDSQDKGSNKAMTGAFKYAQRQTFMISTGDDGDKVASEILDKQFSTSAPPTKPVDTFKPVYDTNTSHKQQTSTTGESVRLASEAQVKLLRMKRNYAGWKDNDRINAHFGWNLNSLTEVPASEVNNLIKFLDQNKAS